MISKESVISILIIALVIQVNCSNIPVKFPNLKRILIGIKRTLNEKTKAVFFRNSVCFVKLANILRTQELEKRSSFVSRRAEDNIRGLSKERSDSEILAVTTDELIEKEANFHFMFYRDYVRIRSNYESQQGLMLPL